MASEVAEELDRAQKDQVRSQDELEFTREGIVNSSKEFTNSWALHKAACKNVNLTITKLNGAFREISNCRATHEAVCTEVKKRAKEPLSLNANTMDAHESVIFHREWRTRS